MMPGLPQVFSGWGLPDEVRICEVSARDGLQAESVTLVPEIRVQLIERLVGAGLTQVEAGSFVSPQAVPQMARTDEVLAALPGESEVAFPVLVPNHRGLADAQAAGARYVAVFASVTESFARANLGGGREKTTRVMADVAREAVSAGMKVRGYLSMVFGDPWEGAVSVGEVVRSAEALLSAGCRSISLGDTVGVATPGHVEAVVQALVSAGVDVSQLALHPHNTYGQALANVHAALRLGVSEFDTSAGGLGGCPFAGSATGNLATEELVWMLDGLGVRTGVDLRRVADTSVWLSSLLGKPPPSSAAIAIANRS